MAWIEIERRQRQPGRRRVDAGDVPGDGPPLLEAPHALVDRAR
jgi:hypothetical protein